MISAASIRLSPGLIEVFAASIADYSSIHLNGEFARYSRFRQRVVHGMLPIAYLLLRLSPASGNTGLRLHRIAARFVNPAFVDDVVSIALQLEATGAGGARCTFEVSRNGGRVVLTSGSVEWIAASRSVEDGTAHAGLFEQSPIESAWTIADLPEGHMETLAFRPQPTRLQHLADAFAELAEETAGTAPDLGDLDPTIVAALPVSTLIGMRLPGRHATFTEFSAEFSAPLDVLAPLELSGTVKAVSQASTRLGLALSWSQGGLVVGAGTATSLVNVAPPQGIPVSQVLSDHLDMGLAGKVALVTGASRGIGEATAKLLAMHGAHVVVHYFRGAEDAAAIVRDIEANGGRASAIQADLREEADVARMFSEIAVSIGGVDVLVNNAVAEFSAKTTETLRTADFLAELNLSLFGMHECCRHCLPYMRQNKWGRIVNLGTVATEMPVGGQNQYITAKSAVTGYTRTLAAELSGSGITVNLVVPRMTDTSLIASIPRGLVQKLAEESPHGKHLQPIEVAKAILFFASNLAANSSGQRLVLNQGEAPFM